MGSVTKLSDPFRKPTVPRLRWLNEVAAGRCKVFLKPRSGIGIWLPVGLPANMDKWLTQPSIRPLWQARGVRPSIVLLDRQYPMELTADGERLRATFAARFADAYEVSARTPGLRFRRLPGGFYEVKEPHLAGWRLDLHDIRSREPRACAPR